MAVPLRTLCLDFNSYFASVEQQVEPSLRGRPLVVAPVVAETTFAIAASYPAKAAGVKTGTRIAEARRLCPGLEVVPARPALYVDFHHRLLSAIETCLPLGPVLSIDEVICDLPPEARTVEGARELARRIKAAIREDVGECLTCSIGIAANGLLAKIASDLQKPDGLVILDDAAREPTLRRLVLRDIPGIGPKMEAHLLAAGFRDVAALLDASPERLRRAWGSVDGDRLARRLAGDDLPWEETRRSSVSHEHVLPPMERNDADARAVLQRLLQKAATRLRRLGYYAACLSVQVRHVDRTKWGAEVRLTDTQDTLELLRALNALWERRPRDGRRPFKVGVALTRLVPAAGHTASLFGGGGDAREALNRALDRLNEHYGKNTIYFGGAHGALTSAPTRIAFSHIPDAVEQREALEEQPRPGRGAVPETLSEELAQASDGPLPAFVPPEERARPGPRELVVEPDLDALDGEALRTDPTMRSFLRDPTLRGGDVPNARRAPR